MNKEEMSAAAVVMDLNVESKQALEKREMEEELQGRRDNGLQQVKQEADGSWKMVQI